MIYFLWGFLILFVYIIIGVITYRVFFRFTDYTKDDSMGAGFFWIISIPIFLLISFIESLCKFVDLYLDRFFK